MRSKAPLMLMEQMIMLLVFALAAALCMQAFVKSDQMSRGSEDRDRAVVLCQSTAETIRHCGGDMAAAAALLGTEQYGADYLMADYAADWTPAQGTMRYTLGAALVESGTDGLGQASVWVRDEAAGTELFRISVAWQETDGQAVEGAEHR
ncbi:MAG: hypothetical protein HFF17_01770 [Oscillospiraceae bacterium]|nr:hypothetical protein [Oscillospiraceae bacterium]